MRVAGLDARGKALLTVEGRDLARNTRECHRTVVVADREKPVWENTNVETQITLSVALLLSKCQSFVQM